MTFNFQIFYSRIDQVMKSCDCIFAEINKYNETYQSKFLLSVWTVFGTMMVMFAHMLYIQRTRHSHENIYIVWNDQSIINILADNICSIVNKP